MQLGQSGILGVLGQGIGAASQYFAAEQNNSRILEQSRIDARRVDAQAAARRSDRQSFNQQLVLYAMLALGGVIVYTSFVKRRRA